MSALGVSPRKCFQWTLPLNGSDILSLCCLTVLWQRRPISCHSELVRGRSQPAFVHLSRASICSLLPEPTLPPRRSTQWKRGIVHPSVAKMSRRQRFLQSALATGMQSPECVKVHGANLSICALEQRSTPTPVASTPTCPQDRGTVSSVPNPPVEPGWVRAVRRRSSPH